MSRCSKWLGLAALAGVATLVVEVPRLSAQPAIVTGQGGTNVGTGFGAGTTGTGTVGRPQAPAFVPVGAGQGTMISTSPYGNTPPSPFPPGGYGGYPAPGYYPAYSPADVYMSPYPGYNDGLGGYLRGAAAVYTAQGQFMISREQSRQMRTQRQMMEVDYRRRVFDEWLYERQNTPTLEDYRQASIREEQRRSLTQPPLTEILNGSSLNTLLGLAKQAKSKDLPNMRLSEDMLTHINVNPGSNYSVGAVKNLKDSGLNWPLALQSKDFETERKAIDDQIANAVNQAKASGKVDGATLQQLVNAQRDLENKLRANSGNLTPNEFVTSKHFLKEIDDSLKAMQQADLSKYFAKITDCKTTQDLVERMNKDGLRFGPAAGGDESAYQALHYAMSSYVAPILNEQR